MIVELVALVIFWLNALPPSPSVGGKLIPRQIVNGLTIDYAKHCRLQFGKYAQVNEAHNNTIQEQTTGDISLRPTINPQGEYFFMRLTSGRRLNRHSFTPLPLPQDVINGVHCLARCNPKGLDIRDRDRRPILDPEEGKNNDEDDSTYAPSDNDISNNKYESEKNQQIHDNLKPPPDQEMAQQPAGVTIQNENTGVHQNENAGVLQNASTHSPQSGNNDPQIDPNIKMENTIDETGNEIEDGNDA